MLFSMFVAFGTLAVLLIDTIVTGWPAISWNLLNGVPSTVPEEAGARPAILATLYLGLIVLFLSVPIGVLTAIYLEEYADRTALVEQAHRGQHPEPRRRCRRSSTGSSASRSSSAGSASAAWCLRVASS